MALSEVDLEIQEGEFHALCGENGAGKSTLIQILCGATRPSAGSARFNDRAWPFGSVKECEDFGIATIHQEPVSFPDLDAPDNVFLGREIRNGPFLRRSEMRARTSTILSALGQNVDLSVPVGKLPMAQRQMVAMARAMVRDCTFLILDEPTASLSATETDALFQVLRSLKQNGVSILYVSHRLDEVFQLADTVTVLRDGKKVSTTAVSGLTKAALIGQMVGREIGPLAHEPNVLGAEALKVENLCLEGAFQNVSLSVRQGEVVGLAGLVGAGRTEVLETVFGIRTPTSGSIAVGGKTVAAGDVPASMEAGIALVPEDRQTHGLIPTMSVRANLTLAAMPTVAPTGWFRGPLETRVANEWTNSLGIKVAHIADPASSLSGGNQQKVVLAKWLLRAPAVLLLDEPTRGVDVGAKAEVHNLIRQLAKQGTAVLVASSDLPELISLCDRILPMRGGQIGPETPSTESSILEAILPEAGGAA